MPCQAQELAGHGMVALLERILGRIADPTGESNSTRFRLDLRPRGKSVAHDTPEGFGEVKVDH